MDNHPLMKKCSFILYMPDEILIAILSRLPMKEAARTSILGRRWKSLWVHSVCDLDFQASERLRHYFINHSFDVGHMKIAREGYVHRVNKIFQKLQCMISVQRLRVQFPLNATYERDVDLWLRFALSKGVRRLELDLRKGYHCGINCYNFPNILDPIQLQQRLNNAFFPSAALSRLVELKFMSVNISGKVVEYLISKCTSLQLLCVQGSDGLIDLKINNPLSLKHLEIGNCDKMNSLEISAPNLVSFVYIEGWIRTDIATNNIQQLVKLYWGIIDNPISHEISPFRSCFTQLEELILEVDSPPRRDLGLKELNNGFPRLRKLIYNVKFSKARRSLLILSSLINAASMLQEFRLELHDKPSREDRPGFEEERSTHECLKLVEIIGFSGGPAGIELATYFLRICTALEKMVIDTTGTIDSRGRFRDNLNDIEKLMARQEAMALNALYPDTTIVIF